MGTLASYLQGEWVQPSGDGSPIHDATTGQEVGRVSGDGLELGPALEWSRRVGGKATRAATFAERGAWLTALGKLVHANRDMLLDVSRQGGTTRSDGKFDVDGASATLTYYGALGGKLGDARFMTDGEAKPILQSKRFVAQHLQLPRRGLALHINAYNFPAWGMAEKLAVAVLAGMPVVVKPSPTTAPLAHRIVELWVDAGVLPDGVLSLLHGEPEGLFDHLTSQDCVAFTGSAKTGRWLRAHPAVVSCGARVNVEADSVNAAVVGPDVALGTETFEMLVGDVVKDMTQKAGQKCTAIRRVLVPEDLAQDTIDALVERLEGEAVGDPAERGVRVGPVVDAAQRQRVLEGIEALADGAQVVWQAQVDSSAGAFVAPTLLKMSEGHSRVHQMEVFGPVCSVVSYSGDAEEAVRLVRQGDGGLVCSVYSDDVAWSGDVVLGVAPWHGRVHWGSRKVAAQSPGPGTVLPNLVHGGPGRAGGGEELGGVRGLAFYLQRTAIQADRGLLKRILED